MTLLITLLSIAGLLGYYFLIFKPKQDEKRIEKDQSRKDMVDDSDKYDEIINDYPTFHRQ